MVPRAIAFATLNSVYTTLHGKKKHTGMDLVHVLLMIYVLVVYPVTGTETLIDYFQLSTARCQGVCGLSSMHKRPRMFISSMSVLLRACGVVACVYAWNAMFHDTQAGVTDVLTSPRAKPERQNRRCTD
jgi:hypothetical protein